MAILFHIFTTSYLFVDLHESTKHFFHGTRYRLQ